MKQGKENFEFVKDDEKESQRNYIFQDNPKTKIAFYFIAIVLILLIVAVATTGVLF